MTTGRVFWANRKSKLGLRKLSKRPYRHCRAWSTQPPVGEDPMFTLKSIALDELSAAKEEVVRSRGEIRELREQLDAMRHLERAYVEIKQLANDAEAALARNRCLLEEAQEAVDAALESERQARKEADPDTIALKVMYGVDEAMKEQRREVAELRALLAQRDEEIAELKRSKKRLREAIDRLSRST